MGNNNDLTASGAQALIQQTEDKSEISQEVWQAALETDAYNVLWKKGTERAFSSDLLNEKRAGTYVTAGCGIPVFRSETKFDSGTGWPSFTEAIDENVVLKKDYKLVWPRVEVLSSCGEHLGHVFNDGPKDQGGKRWCINGVALRFVPD